MHSKDEMKLVPLQQSQIPEFAEQALRVFWHDIKSQADAETWRQVNAALSPLLKQQLNRALLFSLFLRKNLQNHVDRLLKFIQMETLLNPVQPGDFMLALEKKDCHDESHLLSELRVFRQQQMFRFIFRLFNGLSTTESFIQELSDFADACIQYALDWHYKQLVSRFGLPMSDNSETHQQLIVLGMGKLGAGELNLSSDIDLIFAYPRSGLTQGKDVISNQEFFNLLGQRLIKTLNKKTKDGFVFRVDMRLRPLGQSGPLVNSMKAMEHYYQDQGREWERYAMIKARAIPETLDSIDLENRLKPFVYRRYTDFSAIEALREMKKMINKEVRRLGKQEDIKLGAGGIREIEFIAQVYQLIYGGKHPQLQERRLLTVLKILQNMQLMPENIVNELTEAYYFLRNTEHCLQAVNDQQTHRLPSEETERKYLSLAMGFDTWSCFMQILNSHRESVRRCFDGLIEEPIKQGIEHPAIAFHTVNSVDALSQYLADSGFTEAESNKFLSLIKHKKFETLSAQVKHRVILCLQKLLPLLGEVQPRGNAVSDIVDLLEAILRRSIYLVLLIENPNAMKRLISIACASPWVMRQLRLYPSLLDELLDAKRFDHVSDVNEISDNLQQYALRVPQEDLEGQMDMLRYFKMAWQANIVVSEVRGELPLFRISDYLTHLAEAILVYAMDLAWDEMVGKYGYPTSEGKPYDRPPFCIVAYGKLGGIELSYNSDLDLVFLYEAPLQSMTNGDRSIVNSVFFARMGQRIIHILSTRTPLGQLYEVDMRLRPSGNKGLLVSSVKAFEKYQQEQAWTWEQQALVRARVVSGPLAMREIFSAMRKKTLLEQRPIKVLAQEVVQMREKMFDHLAPPYAKNDDADIFDLKHSRWGIVDIEFMVQFAVLAFAHKFTELVKFTDNIRILEIMADKGLISDHERRDLVDAYQAYRSLGHTLALKQEKNEVSACQFQNQRQVVKKIWRKLILSPDFK